MYQGSFLVVTNSSLISISCIFLTYHKCKICAMKYLQFDFISANILQKISMSSNIWATCQPIKPFFTIKTFLLLVVTMFKIKSAPINLSYESIPSFLKHLRMLSLFVSDCSQDTSETKNYSNQKHS